MRCGAVRCVRGGRGVRSTTSKKREAIRRDRRCSAPHRALSVCLSVCCRCCRALALWEEAQTQGEAQTHARETTVVTLSCRVVSCRCCPLCDVRPTVVIDGGGDDDDDACCGQRVSERASEGRTDRGNSWSPRQRERERAGTVSKRPRASPGLATEPPPPGGDAVVAAGHDKASTGDEQRERERARRGKRGADDRQREAEREREDADPHVISHPHPHPGGGGRGSAREERQRSAARWRTCACRAPRHHCARVGDPEREAEEGQPDDDNAVAVRVRVRCVCGSDAGTRKRQTTERHGTATPHRRTDRHRAQQAAAAPGTPRKAYLTSPCSAHGVGSSSRPPAAALWAPRRRRRRRRATAPASPQVYCPAVLLCGRRFAAAGSVATVYVHIISSPARVVPSRARGGIPPTQGPRTDDRKKNKDGKESTERRRRHGTPQPPYRTLAV